MPLVQYLPFGQLIQHYRRERGWTRADLAQQTERAAHWLNTHSTNPRPPYSALSIKTIEALERGMRKRAYATTVDVLAGAFWSVALHATSLDQLRENHEPCRLFYEAWHWAVQTQGHFPTLEEALIGREAELHALSALFKSATPQIVTISGQGGVGKTHLALAVAHSVMSKFPDGLYWVPLGSISEAHLVLPVLAQQLHTMVQSDAQTLASIVEQFQHQRALVVCDNFEQVRDAAPVIATIAQRCPSLRFLITSREPLNVVNETVFHLQPLALPDPRVTPSLTEQSQVGAVAFFLARAQAVMPDLTVNDHTVADITTICEALQGLPLALQLVAPALRVMSLDALCRRVQHDQLDLLEDRQGALPHRQETMRRAIGWSYIRLSEPEQRLFRHLCFWPGGTTEREVAACQQLPSNAPIADLLAALVAKAVVQVVRTGDQLPRYRLHPLLCEFGREQTHATEQHALQAQFVAYWCHEIAAISSLSEAAGETLWQRRLRHETVNLREVAHLLLGTEQQETLLRCVHHLARLWRTHGRADEGRRWLDAVLPTLPQNLPLEAQAWAHWHYAAFCFWLSDFGQTYAHAQTSLRLFEQEHHTVGMLQARVYIANGAINLGRTAEAIVTLQAGLRAADGDALRQERAYLLLSLGCAYQEAEATQAQACFEECIALFNALGDVWGSIRATMYLAQQLAGDGERQQRMLAEALALARERHYLPNVAEILLVLGRIAVRRHDYERAHGYAREAVEIFDDLDDDWGRDQAQAILAICGHEAAALLPHA